MTAARFRLVLLGVGILLLATFWAGNGTVALGGKHGEGGAMTERGPRLTAPEIPEGLEWLNTGRPLSLRELRGKVVLLDFWTYCCINCQHVIPDLKRLEAKYPDELVVIGVHSAKFTTEQGTDNIRQAILRHGLHHPVVNDRDFQTWQRYTVKAWPTLVLIDPAGKIVTSRSGEGIYEPFDRLIGQLIAEGDAKGQISRKPLALATEASKQPKRLLSFPGKILADEDGQRLFIADTNHNRILITALATGEVQAVIGSGTAGRRNGRLEQAEFNHPQGLALDGDMLYVADTENHLIRRVNLATKQVGTVAGNGRPVRFPGQDGEAMSTSLNSPWDLVRVGHHLYIAMAGNHQIWAMDLKSGRIRLYAGSGREGREDGELTEAALAQPIGITTDGKRLYFADSETSSIRWADLPPGKQVGTIVGVDLFEFGDKDGTGSAVRLQHPLGLTWHDGQLYVADTYNSKIKRIDPRSRTSETLLGDGQSGFADQGRGRLAEPGGLSIAAGRLYIADTNNHAIRVADLKSGGVLTLALKGLERMMPAARQAPPDRTLAAQSIRPGKGSLTISLALPAGFKLNADSPSQVVLSVPATSGMRLRGQQRLTITKPTFPLAIPIEATAGQSQIDVDLSLFYCEKGKEALCYVKNERLGLPVTVETGAMATALRLDVALAP